MIRAVAAELRNQFSRPVFPILWTFLVLYVLYSYVNPVLQAEAQLQNPGEIGPTREMVLANVSSVLPENSIIYTSAAIAVLGSLIAGVFGALSIGSEYSWKTVRLLSIFNKSRLRVLLVKALALLAMLMVGYVVLLALGVAASLWAAQRLDQTSQLGALTAFPAAAIAACFGGLILWCSLGFAVALIFRSAITGVVFTILYPILEVAVLPLTSPFQVASPGGAQGVINYRVFGDLEGGIIGFPPAAGSLWVAGIMIAAYVLVAILAACITFGRQDLR